MKQAAIKVMIIIAAIGGLVGIAHEYVINEPIKYFSDDPSRLLPVIGIAMAYGILWAGFNSLPIDAQRVIQLLSWGLAACFMTLLFTYFAAVSYFQISVTSNPDYLRLVILGLIIIAIMMTYLWYEFFRSLKTKNPKRKAEA